MKSLKILALLFAIPYFADGQAENDSLKVLHLNDITYNYKKCQFIAKPGGKWIKRYGRDVFLAEAVIKNNSDDTLKYGMWTTWYLNFAVDNKDLELEGQWDDILHNFIIIQRLAPHKSETYQISTVNRKGLNAFHGKFRIGFRLVVERGIEIMNNYFLAPDGSFIKLSDDDLRKRTHLIWSNTLNM